MKYNRVVYTSDLHGNEAQYQKLVAYALKIAADILIIGGDITQKDFSNGEIIENQRTFLRNELPKLLSPLNVGLPKSKIFLMMGNDDCKINEAVLEENKNLFQNIHNKRLKLTEEFELVGYSFVPITPFGIKDWEKFDLSTIPKALESGYLNRKMKNYQFAGKKSTKTGWKDFQFNSDMEKQDSIQKDLSKNLFTKKTNQTVYAFHSPPDKTHLDQIGPGNHVGSMAIRLFIENHLPYLTLHGHIHETVEVSGSFKDKINKTSCLSSGNHNIGNQLALLVFDLKKPEEAKRIII